MRHVGMHAQVHGTCALCAFPALPVNAQSQQIVRDALFCAVSSAWSVI